MANTVHQKIYFDLAHPGIPFFIGFFQPLESEVIFFKGKTQQC
jgi:hypothetical protein